MTLNNYLAFLEHDNGKIKIKVLARDEENAIFQIMNFENCPRNAIVKIKLND